MRRAPGIARVGMQVISNIFESRYVEAINVYSPCPVENKVNRLDDHLDRRQAHRKTGNEYFKRAQRSPAESVAPLWSKLDKGEHD